MQLQLAVVMAQLQLLVVAGVDPEDALVGVDDLKPPELIHSSMTYVLDDGRVVLKSRPCDVQVELVVEALDDVDLTGLKDVPALVVAVVGLVDGDLLALLLGCFRDVDELAGVGRDDEAGSFQHFVAGDLDERPHVGAGLRGEFLQDEVAFVD